ncbi:hypothetical protein BDK51DRAFT_38410 [Blyttiomyces helicus]|uniref:Uncharacterized protein n=1 Tax=Blyttiomyces helicus TaxID=388810 RepID=A0A4P9W2S0_9FUNG|nr:hypothetical protein BDK51DRAFT_38410 [Blyttiomyces helicus]|eukprot:RKO86559.1 hypothetical protein BDK51DRAFT_38410 [Blyttiomyces helicus]
MPLNLAFKVEIRVRDFRMVLEPVEVLVLFPAAVHAAPIGTVRDLDVGGRAAGIRVHVGGVIVQFAVTVLEVIDRIIFVIFLKKDLDIYRDLVEIYFPQDRESKKQKTDEGPDGTESEATVTGVVDGAMDADAEGSPEPVTGPPAPDATTPHDVAAAPAAPTTTRAVEDTLALPSPVPAASAPAPDALSNIPFPDLSPAVHPPAEGDASVADTKYAESAETPPVIADGPPAVAKAHPAVAEAPLPAAKGLPTVAKAPFAVAAVLLEATDAPVVADDSPPAADTPQAVANALADAPPAAVNGPSAILYNNVPPQSRGTTSVETLRQAKRRSEKLVNQQKTVGIRRAAKGVNLCGEEHASVKADEASPPATKFWHSTMCRPPPRRYDQTFIAEAEAERRSRRLLADLFEQNEEALLEEDNAAHLQTLTRFNYRYAAIFGSEDSELSDAEENEMVVADALPRLDARNIVIFGHDDSDLSNVESDDAFSILGEREREEQLPVVEVGAMVEGDRDDGTFALIRIIDEVGKEGPPALVPFARYYRDGMWAHCVLLFVGLRALLALKQGSSEIDRECLFVASSIVAGLRKLLSTAALASLQYNPSDPASYPRVCCLYSYLATYISSLRRTIETLSPRLDPSFLGKIETLFAAANKWTYFVHSMPSCSRTVVAMDPCLFDFSAVVGNQGGLVGEDEGWVGEENDVDRYGITLARAYLAGMRMQLLPRRD